ncbi:probable 2-carboxy-D-arabinitol-1-phosphatase [Magnolia sinica]|uniref:probable 2-carboxy-D-arabinitol-1-phosphatase n=1 Tax=Magnolia sinica TaxID=86752 RepID=UPI00265ABA7E|nr:probable 2-carboxy-D-arabinitol-1-phosphatase [Magnolia sinica]
MLSLLAHPRPFFHQTHHKPITVRSSSSLHQAEKKSPPSIDTLGDVDPQLYVSVSFPPIAASKRVVLVRHGQSTWNEEGRIQGSSDYSVLTQKGEAQAETSRQMLLSDTFHVCFHSPLIRSKRTAEIIWADRDEEMIPEFDLREIDLYSFQGLLKHEGKEKFGEAYRQWQKDAANFNIDGHYPVRELWARAKNCWNKILKHEGKCVLVVAHNAVNQALVATAIGLGTKYFRILLQSNCGVSVLDFTPRPEGGSPYICLNRLNQTPNSPIAAGSSGGRKTSKRIVLACYGVTQSNSEVNFLDSGDGPMNMLGVIQSQRTAELLLDIKVSSIVCSPRIASLDTATAISKVQEAADCLGADCVPRYVEIKQIQDLEIENILLESRKDPTEISYAPMGWLNGYEDGVIKGVWDHAAKAWNSLLDELSEKSGTETNVVVVAHPLVHIALIGHCLNLTKEWMDTFHLDSGSITVIDFPDDTGRGIVRCVNYTAHLGRWSIPVTRSILEDEEF